MLKLLSGPDKPRGHCRMCDLIPREFGSLYCALCKKDVYTLAAMSWRDRHPAGCFCVDCQCEEQRNFRRNQAHARRIAKLYAYGVKPPEPPEPEPPVGPRVA